jgi:hypothetical protein
MAPKIILPSGGILLLKNGRTNWEWEPEGDVPPGVLETAHRLTDGYQYSTGDGYPGYRLVVLVARAVGGQAILPPLPPMPDGAIP